MGLQKNVGHSREVIVAPIILLPPLLHSPQNVVLKAQVAAVPDRSVKLSAPMQILLPVSRSWESWALGLDISVATSVWL